MALPARDDAEATTRSSAPAAIVVASDVFKSFGATRALSGATLELRRGETHILLGENGAGKSTLAKIIAGVHRPDSGDIRIDGQPASIDDVLAARRLGIGMVFQELSLAPHLTVRENLFLGYEGAASPLSLLRRERETERGRAVLRRLRLDLPLEARVTTLAIAQKQIVEIAKVLVRDPRIIIMDEPTATLTEREKGFLFGVIRSLRDSGVTILYVTHHLREVFEIGDRVSAMIDGKVATTLDVTPAVTEESLLKLLTGREAAALVEGRARPQGDPLLTVAGLATRGGCEDLDLAIRPGEIVGVYGVVGCGREGLGRALVGLERPLRGQIRFDGRPYQPRHPTDARRAGIRYLPMDRKEKGILAERPIRENLNLSRLRTFAPLGILAAAHEMPATLELLGSLLVRYGSAEDRITALSGGNQQKVLFGRAIATRPKLLVMEDPTAGIDVGAKIDLYRLVHRLATSGTSFLIFSSDLPETLRLCDRVYTMYGGRIIDELPEPSLADEGRVLADVLGREADTARREGPAT